MYLKALEIQGFKSFPDKTVLTFGSDITAIVGPNGSGKSNVADAIRWVMGEQSTKELRGGKMEDVIFGGTPKRPQVGYAQVSLIIDNTAHILPLEEIEVGDFLQLRLNKDRFDHTPIVVEAGSPPTPDNVLVAAHSDDADFRPLSSYPYQALRCLHILGAWKWEERQEG